VEANGSVAPEAVSASEPSGLEAIASAVSLFLLAFLLLELWGIGSCSDGVSTWEEPPLSGRGDLSLGDETTELRVPLAAEATRLSAADIREADEGRPRRLALSGLF